MNRTNLYEEISCNTDETIIIVKKYSSFIKRVFGLLILLIIVCYISDYYFFCRSGDFNIFHYIIGDNLFEKSYNEKFFYISTFIGFHIFLLLYFSYFIFSNIFKIMISENKITISLQFQKKIIITNDQEDDFIFKFSSNSNEIFIKKKNINLAELKFEKEETFNKIKEFLKKETFCKFIQINHI